MDNSLKKKYYQNKRTNRKNFFSFRKVIIIIFVLLFLAILVAVIFFLKQNHSFLGKKSVFSSPKVKDDSFSYHQKVLLKNNLPKANPQELEKNYKSQIRKISSFYENSKEDITIDSSRQIIDQLLSLAVPYQYKGFHLKLIVAFSGLEHDLANHDQPGIEDRIKTIDKILQNHP